MTSGYTPDPEILARFQARPDPDCHLNFFDSCLNMAKLLELVSAQPLEDLRYQGFTDRDLFELRRLATVYRTGNPKPSDRPKVLALADKMDPVGEFI